jgi:hypothetical protein
VTPSGWVKLKVMLKARLAGVALVVALGGVAAVGTSCASVRNGLGTSSSVCFRAIPVGRSALGKQTSIDLVSGSEPPTPKAPEFVGVRSATQKDIDAFGKKHDSYQTVLTKRNGGPLKSICLVAFKGAFDPSSVKYLLGTVPSVGHRSYAVVVVSEPSNKILATFLRSKEPISFTHFAVGEA